MLKALIFDMDGTLIDSERVHFQAWCRNLAGHRVEPPGFHLFADYVGASDEQMAGDFIEAYRLKVSVAELVSAKQALYRELVPQICLLPGVRQVIHRFHGRYRLAVASSSPCAELIEILEFPSSVIISNRSSVAIWRPIRNRSRISTSGHSTCLIWPPASVLPLKIRKPG